MDKVIRQAVYIAFGVAIVLYLAQLFTHFDWTPMGSRICPWLTQLRGKAFSVQ